MHFRGLSQKSDLHCKNCKIDIRKPLVAIRVVFFPEILGAFSETKKLGLQYLIDSRRPALVSRGRKHHRARPQMLGELQENSTLCPVRVGLSATQKLLPASWIQHLQRHEVKPLAIVDKACLATNKQELWPHQCTGWLCRLAALVAACLE